MSHRNRRKIRLSLSFVDRSGLLDSLPQQQIYQPLLDAYLQWMRHYQHASDGTLQVRSHSITQFLQWLSTEATPEGLFKLTAERIEKSFLSYAQNMGRSAWLSARTIESHPLVRGSPPLYLKSF